MNTSVLPQPKGMPAKSEGTQELTLDGSPVQANQNIPMGDQNRRKANAPDIGFGRRLAGFRFNFVHVVALPNERIKEDGQEGSDTQLPMNAKPVILGLHC